ncbi:MAG: SDR family oxidoreductase, partial [Gammaproteobacteria bacterium]|nr:SDR family oxidoreductase [Gammaproteobacteria bacterium]
MMTEQRVRNGEVELAVYHYGEHHREHNGRPTLLLVHGYPDCANVWHRCALQLAEHYHVVTYDVRGAGSSSAPGGIRAYAIPHLMKDLETVLDAVSPDRPVHLVAHDWGSIQCWEAATTAPLRARLASFTSMSGPSLDHAGFWIRKRLGSREWRRWQQLANQVAHSWYIVAFQLPVLAPGLWKLGLGQAWPQLVRWLEGAQPHHSASQTRDGALGVNLYRANVLPRLLKPAERRTDLPVQLLVPDEDAFVSPALFEDLLDWAPHLWRHDIAAGHWAQLSHPKIVAGHIQRFVQFVEQGTETADLARARVRRTTSSGALNGKLAVVTGAGSGIGRETLLQFAHQGAEVVAADIHLEAAERSAAEARALGVSAHALQVDVGSADAMQHFASDVI